MRRHFTGKSSTGLVGMRSRTPIRMRFSPGPTIISRGSRPSKTVSGKTPWRRSTAGSSLVGPQAGLLDTRGVVHLSLRRTQDAITDFESAFSNDASPNTLFHLSQAYFQANDKERSKRFLREAKARGLDRDRVGPGAVHLLERPAYQKLMNELGVSSG